MGIGGGALKANLLPHSPHLEEPTAFPRQNFPHRVKEEVWNPRQRRGSGERGGRRGFPTRREGKGTHRLYLDWTATCKALLGGVVSIRSEGGGAY